jgi:hypothetical protein
VPGQDLKTAVASIAAHHYHSSDLHFAFTKSVTFVITKAMTDIILAKGHLVSVPKSGAPRVIDGAGVTWIGFVPPVLVATTSLSGIWNFQPTSAT